VQCTVAAVLSYMFGCKCFR